MRYREIIITARCDVGIACAQRSDESRTVQGDSGAKLKAILREEGWSIGDVDLCPKCTAAIRSTE